MGSASVVTKTTDLIARVSQFTGVVGAIAVASGRGPVGVPFLATGEIDVLTYWTETGRVPIGADNAMWSAINYLQKNDQLWMVRPDNGSEYAAMVIQSSAATGPNASVPNSVTLLDPEEYLFNANEAVLIYANSPGSWGNGLSVEIIDNSSKVATSFYVDVYQQGSRVERTLCSRVPGTKDTTGVNIYVEDSLQSSIYVRAIDNITIDPTTPIKFSATTPVPLANGDDGDPVTDGMLIDAMTAFEDTEGYSITLILDGGRATPAYGLAMTQLAETRGDALALLSCPYSAEASSDPLNAVLDYVNTTLTVNSNAAALYSSHVQIYDRFNDRNIWVSPESFAGCVIGENADSAEIFYAPAGDTAVLDVLDVKVRWTKGQRDALADASVNPLRYTKGKGIRIWGQRTLAKTAQYQDRVNVKLLMITIQPEIEDLLDGFIFDFSDQSTWQQIKDKIDVYMETIKGKRGVTWYNTICDSSTNTRQLIESNIIAVTLQLTPNTAGETIVFSTQLTDNGTATTTVTTVSN